MRIGMSQPGEKGTKLGIGVDMIIHKCVNVGSTDNLSIISLCLVKK